MNHVVLILGFVLLSVLIFGPVAGDSDNQSSQQIPNISGVITGPETQYDDNEALYESLTEPETADEWNMEGNSLSDQGLYEDAIQAYNKAIDLDPSIAAYYRNCALALFNLGEYDESLEYVKKALDISPRYFDAWNDKGRAYQKLGRYDEAIAAFDKVIEIDALRPYGHGNKADSLYYLGKYSDALPLVEKAIRLAPDIAYYWTLKGDILRELGRYDDALVAYDEAAMMDPGNLYTFGNKGSVYRLSGRYQDAIEMFEKQISGSPNAWVWNEMGLALTSMGDYEKALDAYNQTLQIDPSNSFANEKIEGLKKLLP